ncbi:DUF6173 family protein [Vreelandella aquamarina]
MDYSDFPPPYVPPTMQQILRERDAENSAEAFYHKLIRLFNDFHRMLDKDHEAGARLVSFGQSFTFHITNISYWDPSLIIFEGVNDDGSPVELVQHVTQISVLMVALKRREPEAPKRPIGFMSWDEYEEQTTDE